MTGRDQDTWNQVRILQTRPPDVEDIYDTVEIGEVRYWECGNSGWHMLVAWLAGPQSIVCYPEDRPQVWEHEHDYNAETRSFSAAETAEERELADDGINAYLRDSGLPERPGGYRWFQVLPATLDASKLMAAVNKTVLDSNIKDSNPATIIPVVEDFVRRVYGSSQ